MKVRMRRNSVTPLRKGEVYDLPDSEAQRLVALNAAVEAEAPKPKGRKSAASSKADETDPE